MHHKPTIIGAFILIGIATLACSFSNVLSTEDAVATAVAKALDERAMQTAAAQGMTTQTPYPTYTSYPTYTPIVTEEPYTSSYSTCYTCAIGTVEPSGYCNYARMESETILDNSVFDPGDTFTKTWTIKNIGWCTWNSSYDLVFKSGNSMSGNTAVDFPHAVKPGETISLSTSMTAPSTAGTYRGYWTIRTDEGYRFGNLWVQIVVD